MDKVRQCDGGLRTRRDVGGDSPRVVGIYQNAKRIKVEAVTDNGLVGSGGEVLGKIQHPKQAGVGGERAEPTGDRS